MDLRSPVPRGEEIERGRTTPLAVASTLPAGDEPEASEAKIEPPRGLGATISGRYQVVGKLGEGGAGEVYEARHVRLQRTFALKLLHKSDETSRARFRREALLAAQLDHEGIVEVYDLGELDDGTPFLVLERIPGPSLAKVLDERGALASDDVCRIGARIADALHVAHEAGVVHRDLKPANVVLQGAPTGEWPIKIVDFGVAQVAGSVSLTMAGRVVGTPLYMAPEQVLGARGDHRVDIYALGTLLFELVAGVTPFESEDLVTVMRRQVVDAPPRASEHAPRPVDPRLEDIIARCLAKEPERRFQSMRELARVLRGEEPLPVPRPSRRRAPPRGTLLLVALMACAAVAFAGALVARAVIAGRSVPLVSGATSASLPEGDTP